MKELTLRELAEWCGGTLVPENAVGTITSMEHDSRHVRIGALFVALPGERVDGHDFVENAKKAGAVAALVNHQVDCGIPQVVVEDTLRPTATSPEPIGK